jgi:hypothetical protein
VSVSECGETNWCYTAQEKARIALEKEAEKLMTADDYVGIVTLVQRELWNKGRIELVDEYYAKGCMIHGTGEEIVVADAIKNAMIQLRTKCAFGIQAQGRIEKPFWVIQRQETGLG